jgi:hypothetical protein
MKTELTAQELLGLFSLLFLGRHGNAPTVQGVPDRVKPLSDKGRAQAASVAEQIATICYDAVFSSPLHRANETAKLVTGWKEVTPLSTLEISEDATDPLNIMFNSKGLGYAPLSKYFEHPLAEDLKNWAFKALEQIVEESRKLHPTGMQVLVGGHAVCQPAIGWALAQVLKGDNVKGALELEDAMMTIDLGEAEVITIRFGDEIVVDLIRPELAG